MVSLFWAKGPNLGYSDRSRMRAAARRAELQRLAPVGVAADEGPAVLASAAPLSTWLRL